METEIKRTYWGNGKLQSERPRVDGVLHGTVKWWRESGQLSSEHIYVDGKRHGIMKWWYQDGQLESEHTYVDGKRHGMEKYWWQNGDIDCLWLYNQDELVAKFFPRNQTQKWKLK
jgi:antitoxin component YwqK of YwqJK toxin-antitoxin module